MQERKTCSTCEKDKLLREFSSHPQTSDGKYPQCTRCRSIDRSLTYSDDAPDPNYLKPPYPTLTAERHNRILAEQRENWEKIEARQKRTIMELRTLLEYYTSKFGKHIDSKHKELLKAYRYGS